MCDENLDNVQEEQTDDASVEEIDVEKADKAFDDVVQDTPTPESPKSDEKKDAPKKQKDFFRSFLEQIELIIVALAAIILLFTFVGRTCRVDGDSMANTLHSNELVITTNLFYKPERNDIIVFHQTGKVYNEPIVKRIIGLPGDTVKIEYFSNEMQVTVTYPDGSTHILNEDYIKYDYPTYSNMTVYVEEGTVFAMGDNRSHSADSRSPAIGLIDQRRILGKVIWRVAPFDSFGKID